MHTLFGITLVLYLLKLSAGKGSETKFGLTFCRLHFKDHLRLQYNFFGRIFVTLFLVEIFNFIRCKNSTTTDVMLYNDVYEIAYFITYNKCKITLDKCNILLHVSVI